MIYFKIAYLDIKPFPSCLRMEHFLWFLKKENIILITQFSWVIFHLDTRSRANAQVARYLELNVIHGQSPSYNRWIHITRLLEPMVINTFYIWMYEQTINISSWKYYDAKNLFKFHPTGRLSRGVVDRLIQDQNSEKNASCWCLISKDLTSYDLTQNPEQKKKNVFSWYLQNISLWE